MVRQDIPGALYIPIPYLVGRRHSRRSRPLAGISGVKCHSHFVHLRLRRPRNSQHHLHSQDLLRPQRVEALSQKSRPFSPDSAAAWIRLWNVLVENYINYIVLLVDASCSLLFARAMHLIAFCTLSM